MGCWVNGPRPSEASGCSATCGSRSARAALGVLVVFALAAQMTISIDPAAASLATDESASPDDPTDSGINVTRRAATIATQTASSHVLQSSVTISDGGVNTRRTNAVHAGVLVLRSQ